mmetsp:Transcript_929/g.1665  ORF Transcript_929/g.1665 Transcript_929/m.1665 type:complete len:133 (+) Transcript_929:1073-1471(+)
MLASATEEVVGDGPFVTSSFTVGEGAVANAPPNAKPSTAAYNTRHSNKKVMANTPGNGDGVKDAIHLKMMVYTDDESAKNSGHMDDINSEDENFMPNNKVTKLKKTRSGHRRPNSGTQGVLGGWRKVSRSKP